MKEKTKENAMNNWDLNIEGSGLKQKVRDLSKLIETEVKSARAEITVLKGDGNGGAQGEWYSDERVNALLDKTKKELMGEFEASKADLMKHFEIQKSENERLSQQIRQNKQDNVGLQQSLIALQRRILDIEEDIGK